MLKQYILFRCSKKTNNIDKCLEGLGIGMISLWGLQNTTSSKYTIIAEKDSGKVVRKFIGNKSGFPEVLKEDDLDEYIDLDLIAEFTL